MNNFADVKTHKDVDWEKFGTGPGQTVICICGAEYDTHCYYVSAINNKLTKDACPGCKKHDKVARIKRKDRP